MYEYSNIVVLIINQAYNSVSFTTTVYMTKFCEWSANFEHALYGKTADVYCDTKSE